MSKPEWKIPIPGTGGLLSKYLLTNNTATFKAHCVALRHKETGTIVAGEIGYTIGLTRISFLIQLGATYTSLTGFFDTDKVSGSNQLKYTSAGKVIFCDPN